MRDTIRLAYDNCYQYLMKLKKENKEYKIVEYNLNFDESFSKQAKNIKDIRKEHIRVFSLMPLMIRTKTTIGEFLIRYPQYDMMIYPDQNHSMYPSYATNIRIKMIEYTLRNL